MLCCVHGARKSLPLCCRQVLALRASTIEARSTDHSQRTGGDCRRALSVRAAWGLRTAQHFTATGVCRRRRKDARRTGHDAHNRPDEGTNTQRVPECTQQRIGKERADKVVVCRPSRSPGREPHWPRCRTSSNQLSVEFLNSATLTYAECPKPRIPTVAAETCNSFSDNMFRRLNGEIPAIGAATAFFLNMSCSARLLHPFWLRLQPV
jgi:hypothetical protein